MTQEKKSGNPVIAADFGKRFAIACDNIDRVPPYNFGRLTFFVDEFKQHHGVTITKETVRKWFAGESRPRPDKMEILAEILRVDVAWLLLGNKPDLVQDERNARNAAVEGSINLVIGMLTISGANCAFPEPGDSRENEIHFYTIIGGRQYGVHVSMGQATDQGFRFTCPTTSERTLSIGVVKRSPTEFDFYHLIETAVSTFGIKRGGFIELTAIENRGMMKVDTEILPRIKDFRALRG